MKKLAPKSSIDPPADKKNVPGRLGTDKDKLEQLYLDTYLDILTPNPVIELL